MKLAHSRWDSRILPSPCSYIGDGRTGAGGRTDGRNKSQNNHFILERSAAITDSAVNEASEETTTDRAPHRPSVRPMSEGRKAAMTGQACGGGGRTP